MKRYEIGRRDNEGDWYPGAPVESPEGRWVKFEDISHNTGNPKCRMCAKLFHCKEASDLRQDFSCYSPAVVRSTGAS